jgi:hypothetical protein
MFFASDEDPLDPFFTFERIVEIFSFSAMVDRGGRPHGMSKKKPLSIKRLVVKLFLAPVPFGVALNSSAKQRCAQTIMVKEGEVVS